ncbi:hypothetical protein OD350_28860 (plasmid) [Clostridium beijerinckii]|uniref:hypothetical protein n=1 Tax=Clostridium beijerinckii TaxID=1520 RepID=UPI002226913B|nr:hypothetical protein [Clostridium beijerinckii]UYZ39086.1 hypothetical protein OD350_28860 [Clostridium beijerinckii]
MIINLVDKINDILEHKDNKQESIESIMREVEAGMDALRKHNEVIYIIKKNLHIKTYPLFEVGKSEYDIIRNSRDFCEINKYNSLKREEAKVLKELRANLNDEQLKLLNDYIDKRDNKPLFASEIIKIDTIEPKVINQNIGVHFNIVYAHLAGYINSLCTIFDEDYLYKKLSD